MTAKELGIERWLEEISGSGTLWPQYVSVIESVLDEACALPPWRRAESAPGATTPKNEQIAPPVSTGIEFSQSVPAKPEKKSLLRRLFGRV